MSNKKIKFAVVGCGRISNKHLQSIKNLDGAQLVAICDIDHKKLDKIDYVDGGEHLKKYHNFLDMVTDEHVDVINICTPSGLHYDMAIKALEAGKDVILEKPMALSSSDASHIIKVSQKTGRILLPVMQNRFNPAISFLKTHMDKMGGIKYINASCFWYRPQSYYDDGWHGTRNMDGGVLMNQAIHYVDMICFLLGKEPKIVSAMGGTYIHNMECEDVISLNIRFKNNILASLQANTISYPENFEGSITIFFEKATVKIAGKALNEIVYWKGEGEELINQYNNFSNDDIYGDGHRKVIKNMYDIKCNNCMPYITNKEALWSIKIVEAAYLSMAEEKFINI